MSGVVPIITCTMLRYDPKTFHVYVDQPRRPLGRMLAGFAAAGLATRAVEALAMRRR